MADGKGPEKLLLLISNSYKYFNDAIMGLIVPEKLLLLAWKIARSGSWVMKLSREGAERPKPLKSTAATAVAVRLSGGLSQTKPV